MESSPQIEDLRRLESDEFTAPAKRDMSKQLSRAFEAQ